MGHTTAHWAKHSITATRELGGRGGAFDTIIPSGAKTRAGTPEQRRGGTIGARWAEGGHATRAERAWGTRLLAVLVQGAGAQPRDSVVPFRSRLHVGRTLCDRTHPTQASDHALTTSSGFFFGRAQHTGSKSWDQPRRRKAIHTEGQKNAGPTPQSDCTGDTEPAAQKNPAEQFPLQDGSDSPGDAP